MIYIQFLRWVMFSLYFEVSAPFSFMNCICVITRVKKAGPEYRRSFEICVQLHQIRGGFFYCLTRLVFTVGA